MHLTKKQEFLADFDSPEVDQLCVFVSVPKAPEPEYIINTKANFEVKKTYYDRAYDDKLQLKKIG